MVTLCFLQATQRIKQHSPCGFAYVVVTKFEEYKRPVEVYRDNGAGNVAEVFISSMYEEYERLENLIHAEEEMKALTQTQLQAHDSALICYLCEEAFTADDGKVKDHCHYT